MVLKKSNSIFNSGVTQRITNRGALFDERYRDAPLPEHISIYLTGHDDTSNKNLSTFRTVLDTIYEFLDWQGPDLSSFYDKDGFPRIQKIFNEIDFTKHQKGSFKPMSERLRELTKAGILEDFADDIEVEINIQKHLIHRPMRPSPTLLSWKSTSKKEENISCEEKKSKRKRFHNQHNRGIQRPARVSNQERKEEQDNALEPSRKIAFTFKEAHQVDVRLLERVTRINCYFYARRNKALCKAKSYVNGHRSDFKGYNRESIKSDVIEILSDAQAEEDNTDYSSHEEFSNDDFESEEETSKFRNEIVLLDYVQSFHSPRLQNKVKKVKTESSLNPVNSASSEMVRRHPKGSCIFLKETNTILMTDVDSGFDSSSSDTTERLKDDHSESDFLSDSSDKTPSTQNIQLDLISTIADFNSRFFPAEITLPTELETQVKSYSTLNDSNSDKKYSIHNCQVTFGNSYPPSFMVKPKPELADYDQNCYLVGKAFKMCQGQTWSWQLQVGHMTSCDPDPDVINVLLNIIRQNANTNLDDIVEAFQESVLSTPISFQKPSHMTGQPQSLSLSSPPTDSPWNRLSEFISNHRTVCHEKALVLSQASKHSILQSSNSETGKMTSGQKQDIDHFNTDKSSQLEYESYMTICDICFLPCDFSQGRESQALTLLPCGHTFCSNCWSSHVLIGLSTGCSITCMDCKCKQELNETLLRSLVPGHLVSKWCQQNLEKEIEKDPRCKWCPNTRCNKVAVIENCSDSINQFGSLVLCDCHVQWCFSCQRDPHWPASCDQMTAFHQILEKTGNNFEAPVHNVDYTVELKRCPKCHYPIEKNEGCPSMVCRMCWFNFCWNCLRAVDHSVYTCKPRSNNFTTFHLHNKLVYNLPLQFFANYHNMNKKRKQLDKQSLLSWFESLSFHRKRHIRIPFNCLLQVPNNDVETAKEYALRISQSCLDFSKEVYAFLEPLYVLLCFVKLSKEIPGRQINIMLHECLFLAENLQFICWRIEEQILYKKIPQILKAANTVEILVRSGKKQMMKMNRSVQSLQALSRNVDPTPIDKMDPKKFLRYV